VLNCRSWIPGSQVARNHRFENASTDGYSLVNVYAGLVGVDVEYVGVVGDGARVDSGIYLSWV
jgi:hypothetical protein